MRTKKIIPDMIYSERFWTPDEHLAAFTSPTIATKGIRKISFISFVVLIWMCVTFGLCIEFFIAVGFFNLLLKYEEVRLLQIQQKFDEMLKRTYPEQEPFLFGQNN